MKDAEIKRWQAGCAKQMRDIVIPTLIRLAEDIRRMGHDADVNDRLLGHAFPNVELTFTPKNVLYPHSHQSASRLSFVCTETRKVDVKAEVSTPTGDKPRSPFDIIGQKPQPSPLTPEWVEENVVGFVERVLSANKVASLLR